MVKHKLKSPQNHAQYFQKVQLECLCGFESETEKNAQIVENV